MSNLSKRSAVYFEPSICNSSDMAFSSIIINFYEYTEFQHSRNGRIAYGSHQSGVFENTLDAFRYFLYGPENSGKLQSGLLL